MFYKEQDNKDRKENEKHKPRNPIKPPRQGDRLFLGRSGGDADFFVHHVPARRTPVLELGRFAFIATPRAAHS